MSIDSVMGLLSIFYYRHVPGYHEKVQRTETKLQTDAEEYPNRCVRIFPRVETTGQTNLEIVARSHSHAYRDRAIGGTPTNVFYT